MRPEEIQALVLRDQEMGPVNSSAEGRAAYRSAPCTHGYPVYAGHGKRPVLSRVPTHFWPESPRLRRKTLCFQYGGCPGRGHICLLTANSGLAVPAPLTASNILLHASTRTCSAGKSSLVASGSR